MVSYMGMLGATCAFLYVNGFVSGAMATGRVLAGGLSSAAALIAS